jgi:hypothetical protein
MDVIEWMQNFIEEALKNDDQQRLQLVYFAQQADILRESNPEVAFQVYQAGRSASEALAETCWILFFAQRMAHVCIFELENLERAMDMVARDYVLSTQDTYTHCPINSAVRVNLVETYLYYDPVGYADTIQEVVEYLRKTEATNTHLRLQLDDFMAQLHLKLNQLDKALDYSLRTLDDGYGFLTLSRIYWERGEYQKALEISELREEESLSSPYTLADSRAWIAAMLMRTNGDSLKAKSLYKRAQYHIAKINFVPNSTLFDALADYHEASGSMNEALAIRDDQLAKQQAIAGPEEVIIVRLRRARLLGRMGTITEMNDQIAEIRTHLSKIKQPAYYKQLLGLIETGHYSDIVWKDISS